MIEGSIIAHQQVEIETLKERIAGLEQQTFNKFVEREFKKNLELAREEMALEDEESHGEMEYSERRAWNVAVEWTQDDIANQIGRQLEQQWWAKQDAINKAHY